MEIFLLTALLIGIAFIGLGIRIFFHRDKKFPETEIGSNRNMRRLGISCAAGEERRLWRGKQKKNNTLIDPKKLKIDWNNLEPDINTQGE